MKIKPITTNVFFFYYSKAILFKYYIYLYIYLYIYIYIYKHEAVHEIIEMPETFYLKKCI